MPAPYPIASPWFERVGPTDAATPLVITVPHAGRIYPPALLAASAVSPSVLEQLEDRHADLLPARAIEQGAVAFVARVARAWIDLNRGEEDLDPALREPAAESLATARARSGLGLLPQRIGRRDLWRTQPSPDAAKARIVTVHRPYHAAVETALEAALQRFGHAVLIDCHSMPPLSGNAPARVVIGDGHSLSAGGGLAARLARVARGSGYPAAINAPYAGAYSIARHGRPRAGVHAFQIELDRSLYLERDLRTPAAGLAATQALLATLAWDAVDATRPPLAIAAE